MHMDTRDDFSDLPPGFRQLCALVAGAMGAGLLVVAARSWLRFFAIPEMELWWRGLFVGILLVATWWATAVLRWAHRNFTAGEAVPTTRGSTPQGEPARAASIAADVAGDSWPAWAYYLAAGLFALGALSGPSWGMSLGESVTLGGFAIGQGAAAYRVQVHQREAKRFPRDT
jgi:hypothetical protein